MFNFIKGDGYMKLSEITKETLTDDDIQKIVYENINDNGKRTIYGLVFGNSMLINERVRTAVDAYRNNRIKKIIFSGGSNGISNQDNDTIPEAVKMKNLAIELGVNEEDILIDDTSNNSFENVENSFNLIGNENISSIAIITSEFHLKRCMAIIKKQFPNLEIILIPSKDGFSDSNNWFLSDNSWNSGRSLATYEANLLIRYAKENKIADIDILDFENETQKLKK